MYQSLFGLKRTVNILVFIPSLRNQYLEKKVLFTWIHVRSKFVKYVFPSHISPSNRSVVDYKDCEILQELGPLGNKTKFYRKMGKYAIKLPNFVRLRFIDL